MAGEADLHVSFFPWLAFGHIMPFLHLAIALATAGIRISFLSTPRNIRRLPKVPDHLTSRFKFIELPLPPVDGLPEGCESTMDASSEQITHLKAAYDLLQTPIKQFFTETLPDWIIYDATPHWMGPIANECGVRRINFPVVSAATMAFFTPPENAGTDWWASPESMTKTPEWIPFPSKVAFRLREAQGFYSSVFSTNASGLADIERGTLANKACEAILVRSCFEYEGEYLELLKKYNKKSVIPVGVLPPMMPLDGRRAVRDGDDSVAKIFRWLDGQEPKSVLFVSFGSEYKLSEKDVHELAHGLELSNLPFLWILRRPAWMTSGEDEEVLPQGFTSRTEGRGVVSFGWAPQLEILAHPSVGGSLFHSGWGSIIETLRFGHAIVVLPSIFDQGLNARLLVEKGLGIEVERNEDDSFDRDEIARSLRMAMASTEGEKMRVKAREMGAKFADHAQQEKYLKKFVEYLLQARKKLVA